MTTASALDSQKAAAVSANEGANRQVDIQGTLRVNGHNRYGEGNDEHADRNQVWTDCGANIDTALADTHYVLSWQPPQTSRMQGLQTHPLITLEAALVGVGARQRSQHGTVRHGSGMRMKGKTAPAPALLVRGTQPAHSSQSIQWYPARPLKAVHSSDGAGKEARKQASAVRFSRKQAITVCITQVTEQWREGSSEVRIRSDVGIDTGTYDNAPSWCDMGRQLWTRTAVNWYYYCRSTAGQQDSSAGQDLV